MERSGSFIRKQAVNRDNLYASIFRVHQHSILFVVSIAALAVPFTANRGLILLDELARCVISC